MPSRAAAFAPLLLLLVPTLPACTGAAPSGGPHGLDGEAAASEPTDPAATFRAGQLFRPDVRQGRFRASDLAAEQEVEDRLRIIEPAAGTEDAWTERTLDEQGNVLRELRLRRRADGSVELLELMAPTGRTGGRGELGVYAFEPPLLVMPGTLRAGEVVRGEAGVVVRANGAERRGTAESEIELLRPEEIAYAGSILPTQRVRLDIMVRLGPASIERSRLAWVDGGQLLRERDRLEVRLFGMMLRSEDLLLRRRAKTPRSGE